MIVPSQKVRVVIATKPVDFRKGHDGLAAVAERELGLDPHSGLVIVFRAKRADRIKVLLWDGTGLVMAYKRLEDTTFAWPRIQDGGNPPISQWVCNWTSRGLFQFHGGGDAPVAGPVRSPVRGPRLETGAGCGGPSSGARGVTPPREYLYNPAHDRDADRRRTCRPS